MSLDTLYLIIVIFLVAICFWLMWSREKARNGEAIGRTLLDVALETYAQEIAANVRECSEIVDNQEALRRQITTKHLDDVLRLSEAHSSLSSDHVALHGLLNKAQHDLSDLTALYNELLKNHEFLWARATELFMKQTSEPAYVVFEEGKEPASKYPHLSQEQFERLGAYSVERVNEGDNVPLLSEIFLGTAMEDPEFYRKLTLEDDGVTTEEVLRRKSSNTFQAGTGSV